MDLTTLIIALVALGAAILGLLTFVMSRPLKDVEPGVQAANGVGGRDQSGSHSAA